MAKTVAMVMGWIFLVVGVLGFFSNPLVGEGGMFHTDLNHNIVHILFGAILLWAAYKAADKVGGALKTLGILYLLIAILGFFMVDGTGSLLGLVEVNGADNWLHVVLAAVLLWAGFKKSAAEPMPQAM